MPKNFDLIIRNADIALKQRSGRATKKMMEAFCG